MLCLCFIIIIAFQKSYRILCRMADNVNVVNNDNSIPFRQIQDHPRQECMLSDKLPKTISAIHMTTIPNLVILLMLRTLMIEFFNLFKTLSSFNMDVLTSNSLVIISAMIAQASTTVLTLTGKSYFINCR